jgi:hypothetical protein
MRANVLSKGRSAVGSDESHEGKAHVRRSWKILQEYMGRKTLRGLENLKAYGGAFGTASIRSGA